MLFSEFSGLPVNFGRNPHRENGLFLALRVRMGVAGEQSISFLFGYGYTIKIVLKKVFHCYMCSEVETLTIASDSRKKRFCVSAVQPLLFIAK